MDIPDPYAQMPRGQEVSPHHLGCKRTHFLRCRRPRSLVQTSMPRRVLRKLCPETFALIFWSLRKVLVRDCNDNGCLRRSKLSTSNRPLNCFNVRQIMHQIGAQPILWSYMTFSHVAASCFALGRPVRHSSHDHFYLRKDGSVWTCRAQCQAIELSRRFFCLPCITGFGGSSQDNYK